jgi:hypothetical protein
MSHFSTAYYPTGKQERMRKISRTPHSLDQVLFLVSPDNSQMYSSLMKDLKLQGEKKC